MPITSCHDNPQTQYRKNPKHKGHFLALCSAHAKRTGKLCGQLAMPNGKCRLHGGRSSGPGKVLFPEAGDKSGERRLRNKLAVVARRASAKELEAAEKQGTEAAYSVEHDPTLRVELNNAADRLDRDQLAKAIRDYREGTIRFWQFMQIRRSVAARSAASSTLFPG